MYRSKKLAKKVPEKAGKYTQKYTQKGELKEKLWRPFTCYNLLSLLTKFIQRNNTFILGLSFYFLQDKWINVMKLLLLSHIINYSNFFLNKLIMYTSNIYISITYCKLLLTVFLNYKF